MADELMGFRLTLADSEEFFKRCIERNANTLESRLAIMDELKKELRAIKLNEQDLMRMMKSKKVLIVKPGETNNE